MDMQNEFKNQNRQGGMRIVSVSALQEKHTGNGNYVMLYMGR
jgi:hypothetical protein